MKSLRPGNSKNLDPWTPASNPSPAPKPSLSPRSPETGPMPLNWRTFSPPRTPFHLGWDSFLSHISIKGSPLVKWFLFRNVTDKVLPQGISPIWVAEESNSSLGKWHWGLQKRHPLFYACGFSLFCIHWLFCLQTIAYSCVPPTPMLPWAPSPKALWLLSSRCVALAVLLRPLLLHCWQHPGLADCPGVGDSMLWQWWEYLHDPEPHEWPWGERAGLLREKENQSLEKAENIYLLHEAKCLEFRRVM